MPDIKIPNGIITVGGDFKPGDMPPTGYLDWHEWAEVQHKAGLRQVPCGRCGKWKYPQELADFETFTLKDRYGRSHTQASAVCKGCDKSEKEPIND